LTQSKQSLTSTRISTPQHLRRIPCPTTTFSTPLKQSLASNIHSETYSLLIDTYIDTYIEDPLNLASTLLLRLPDYYSLRNLLPPHRHLHHRHLINDPRSTRQPQSLSLLGNLLPPHRHLHQRPCSTRLPFQSRRQTPLR
jgi:hypothetical protein